MKDLERREFLQMLLQTLAASSVVLSVPLSACGEATPRRDDSADGWLPDLDAAMALGQRYLKKYPDPGPLETLRRDVFGGSVTSNEARTRRIAERIESDFLKGNVVRVKGWRLARTEAVLCALIASEGGVPARSEAS